MILSVTLSSIMVWIWLGLLIVLLAFEALTPSDLVTIWFAAGALVALIISIIWPEGIWLQGVVFVVVSILLVVFTRPLARRLQNTPDVKTNIDSIIGKNGKVTITIKPYDVGEIKCDGKLWSAISETEIEEGSIVEVLAVEGVKLIVKKIEE